MKSLNQTNQENEVKEYWLVQPTYPILGMYVSKPYKITISSNEYKEYDRQYHIFNSEKEAWKELHKEMTEFFSPIRNYKEFKTELIKNYFVADIDGESVPLDKLDLSNTPLYKRVLYLLGVYVVLPVGVLYVYWSLKYICKQVKDQMDINPEWFI